MALRALGLAARELGDLTRAGRELEAAAAVAAEARLADREAEARTSLAAVMADRGEVPAALAEAGRAVAAARGPARARARAQHALLLERAGRYDEAVAGYRAAIPGLARARDVIWQARALNNRGVLRAYRGDLPGADADLARAERLAGSAGQHAMVAKALHNRGWTAGRRGDVPAALALYDRAEAGFRALGLPLAPLRMDRCETLLGVRLVPEARQDAEAAVAELEAAGAALELAEALLFVSLARLLDGDPDGAGAVARRAERAFAGQRREGWRALARLAVARAELAAGHHRRALRVAAAARREASDAGHLSAAAEAAAIAAHAAVAVGDVEAARGELDRGRGPIARAPAAVRAGAWHAEARVRAREGRPAGARAALRAAMRALERDAATLGATELRAHAAGRAADVAAHGLAEALAAGRPREVLAWSERWRAADLGAAPPRPPADPELAAALAELRRVAGERHGAELEGGGSPALAAEEAALEDRVRRLARRAPAGAPGVPAAPPGPSAVSAALGERALVEIVRHGDRLAGVVLAGGRARLHDLGPAHAAHAALERLRFALARLAGPPSAAADAHRAATRAAAGALDDQLLGPGRRAVGDRPLVIVPTGALHAVPWSVLPTLAGRPVSISPSAALWLRASLRRPGGGGVVLVAGPGLPGAAREVGAVARIHPGARRLTGARARVGAVARALAGAELAHLAAHGVFRTDNPLFSALRLHDGPLTVYDVEALGEPPRVTVLAACDAGLAVVRPGDALMGLSAALLARGAAAVVAGVGLVPDGAAPGLVTALHTRLRAGDEPAAALAAAAGAQDDLATRGSLVCLGAG